MNRSIPNEGNRSEGGGPNPSPVSRLFSWFGSMQAERYVGFLFVLPWLIAFLAFDLIPTGSAFYYSMTEWNGLSGDAEYIGFDNYQEMFTRDRNFSRSLNNTLYYAISVPLRVVAGFLLALLLNANVKGKGFFRTMFYLPTLIPAVAGAVVWIWIFHTDNGILNYILGIFGVEKIRWLSSPQYSKPALIVMSLWGIGGSMVIYLAGLQDIPEELYEAAEVDGASAFQRLINITLPLMTPTIFFNLIMGIIGSFQVFGAAFVMTGGGPARSTYFYMLYIYEEAFTHWNMGYASALSVILFLLVLVVTIIVNRTSERWVFYQSG